MESAKVEMIEQAIQQLMIEEAGNKQVVSLPAGDDDGGDQDENRLLLSRLLTQLQTTGNDDGIQQADTSTTTTDTKKQPSTTAENNITDNETSGSSGSGDNGREEEIVKELKKVQKQNFITHCLLSAMIVLTITWQVSEVSLILKFKNGINRPFQSIGGLLKDVFKRPTSTSKSSNDQNGGGANQTSSQILAPIQQQIDALPLFLDSRYSQFRPEFGRWGEITACYYKTWISRKAGLDCNSIGKHMFCDIIVADQ